MNLEDDLRRALRRTPAPDDLAGRVAGRIADGTHTPAGATAPRRRSWLRWAAAAAAALLVTTGAVRYYQQQQMIAQAERAEADLRLALQITREKLDLIQRRVNDSLP